MPANTHMGDKRYMALATPAEAPFLIADDSGRRRVVAGEVKVSMPKATLALGKGAS